MSITRDKQAGAFVFEFDRVINGQRVRARKRLPKAWDQAQADKYDREESARLYAVATGTGGANFLIEDAVGVYLKHRVPQLKSGRNVATELAEVFWAYKGRSLSDLAEVAKLIQKKAGDLKPATIKNRIAYLRAACRWAWKHHNIGDSDPGAKVTVPQVRNERHHYITRLEMLKLVKACPNRATRMMIRIAFYSGMRLGEIERAQVVDGRFVLHDTKNGDPRIIPIHPKLLGLLNFPKQTRFMTAYWFRQARAAVGLDHLHFHDLRHSAASELINNGVDLYTVGAVLGHRSAASTKRYAHLATDKLAEAIGKIGKKD